MDIETLAWKRFGAWMKWMHKFDFQWFEDMGTDEKATLYGVMNTWADKENKLVTPRPSPRYDEVFFRGTEEMDKFW